MAQHLTTRSKSLLAAELDYFLVDGSGSMINKWWDMMAMADAYCDTLRARVVNSHLVVSVFSSENTQMIQRDGPLATEPNFHDKPLTSTWGFTPLFDAINHMGRHLRDLDPKKCHIGIVTDGDENNSKYTDTVQAKSILDWAKAHGWQITIIGADFNNSILAQKLGISPKHSLGVHTAKLVDAAKALAEKRARYSVSGQDMHFDDSEKQDFGGYLNPPTKG